MQNGSFFFFCIFARFCAFLRVSVRFSYRDGLRKKNTTLRRLLQKCANNAFMQYPLELCPLLHVTDFSDAIKSCKRGGPLQKHRTPNPPKVLGRVLGEVPARNGCSGKCSEKCLPLVSLLGTSRTSTSPSTPFLAGTSPSTFPSGGLHFCRGTRTWRIRLSLGCLEPSQVWLSGRRDLFAAFRHNNQPGLSSCGAGRQQRLLQNCPTPPLTRRN